MGRSSIQTPKRQRSRSRASNYDEEDEERGYRHPPSKLRSARSVFRHGDEYDDDEADDDADYYVLRQPKAKPGVNPIYFLIVTLLCFVVYLIVFPETNFLGINFIENNNTKLVFGKINEWKTVASSKFDDVRKSLSGGGGESSASQVPIVADPEPSQVLSNGPEYSAESENSDAGPGRDQELRG